MAVISFGVSSGESRLIKEAALHWPSQSKNLNDCDFDGSNDCYYCLLSDIACWILQAN